MEVAFPAQPAFLGDPDDPANAQANFYKAYLAQRAGDAAIGRLFYGRAVAFGGASDERLRAAAIVRRLGPPQAVSADDPGADLPPAVWRADAAPTILWECIDCPQMVVVPAGAYTMGSPPGEAGRVADEGPRLRITVDRPVAVGRFEVSFAEWDACVAGGGCNGYRPSDEGWGRGQRPVINVSWDDAQAYVDWLSRKTGKPYRLLTEAEWEYAARGGRATPYWTGAAIDPAQANIAGKIGQTRPVGAYAPNPFGLYDTAGNVWEWASDCAIPKAADTAGDANAPTQDCSVRVVRGGGWGTAAPLVRSAYPDWATPMTRGNMLGFRIARDLD